VSTEEWWFLSQFYDSGGTTSGRLHRNGLFPASGAPDVDIGVFDSVSTTQYVTTVDGADTPSVAFGTRAAGWNEWGIYVSRPNTGDPTVRFYADGALIRDFTGSAAVAALTDMGMRANGASGSNDDGFYGKMEVAYQKGTGNPTEFEGLVEPTGSIFLPDLQPAVGVESFDSVTITDETAGTSSMEVGSIVYEFQHSTNGGSSFGSLQTLNTANLQALDTASNGQDVIRIKVTFTAGMDDMASAALRKIAVTWTKVNIIPKVMHLRRQMAGVS
jgi:hypothetical protein